MVHWLLRSLGACFSCWGFGWVFGLVFELVFGLVFELIFELIFGLNSKLPSVELSSLKLASESVLSMYKSVSNWKNLLAVVMLVVFEFAVEFAACFEWMLLMFL